MIRGQSIRGRPLPALVAAAVATYPALALGWCVAVLLASQPEAWRLGLAGHPAAVAAAVLVAVGAVAAGRAGHATAGGLRQTLRFRRWTAAHAVPVAGRVAQVAAEVGLGGRLRLVAAGEQVAVTAGLARPYVVVSSGLVDALTTAELRAVLAHEQAHLRRRDPLRLLVAQVLMAHLWFLPVARDLGRRARSGGELAADRDAARRYGRSALAGALLRVVATPVRGGAAVGFGSGAAVTRFADSLLRERVFQLESGHPPRSAPVPPWRAALTALGAAGFAAAVAGAWVFMLATCPCPMVVAL